MSDIVTGIDDGSNSIPNIMPYDVPVAEQWNAWFGAKVDSDGGILINPTVVGDLVLGSPATQDDHAVSKAYVDAMIDASGVGIPDAPADGTYYCRVNNSWSVAPLTQPSNDVAGDMTVTGDMVINGSGTFSNLTVNGPGRFVLNANISWLTITSNAAAAPPPLLPNDTQLQFIGGDGLCSRTEYVSYGDLGILTFRRAKGIGAAPTATSGNIFALTGQGYDGSGWTTSMRAAFYCIAQGTWTPVSTPTFLSWWTTPVNGITATEWMRLQASGNLSIGATADAGYKLDVRASPAAPWIAKFSANAATPATQPTNVGVWLIGADGMPSAMAIDSYGAQAILAARRSNGTAAAPTALADGDTIFTLGISGRRATNYSNANAYSILAEGAYTATANGFRHSWLTCPSGTTIPNVNMILTGAGHLLVGGAINDAGYALDVSGTARISSGLGVFGATPPATRPAFSGAKAGNTALASVIAVLVAAGFGTDTTTA